MSLVSLQQHEKRLSESLCVELRVRPFPYTNIGQDLFFLVWRNAIGSSNVRVRCSQCDTVCVCAQAWPWSVLALISLVAVHVATIWYGENSICECYLLGTNTETSCLDITYHGSNHNEVLPLRETFKSRFTLQYAFPRLVRIAWTHWCSACVSMTVYNCLTYLTVHHNVISCDPWSMAVNNRFLWRL